VQLASALDLRDAFPYDHCPWLWSQVPSPAVFQWKTTSIAFPPRLRTSVLLRSILIPQGPQIPMPIADVPTDPCMVDQPLTNIFQTTINHLTPIFDLSTLPTAPAPTRELRIIFLVSRYSSALFSMLAPIEEQDLGEDTASRIQKEPSCGPP
jgi:hypothetical protein